MREEISQCAAPGPGPVISHQGHRMAHNFGIKGSVQVVSNLKLPLLTKFDLCIFPFVYLVQVSGRPNPFL